MKTVVQACIKILTVAALLALAGCSSSTEDAMPDVSPDPDPPTNSAPTISGQPPTEVMIGESYDFTPVASDPDNDVLTFSASGLPDWVTIDSNSGTVSGTPAPDDVGTSGNIVVTVSDGTASTQLPGFTITVSESQTPSGAITLTWTAPTQNTDDSDLDDLIGFKIYYGLSVNNYSSQITIDDPNVTTYVVENLEPNTYFFAVTAIRAGGIESEKSTVATITSN